MVPSQTVCAVYPPGPAQAKWRGGSKISMAPVTIIPGQLPLASYRSPSADMQCGPQGLLTLCASALCKHPPLRCFEGHVAPADQFAWQPLPKRWCKHEFYQLHSASGLPPHLEAVSLRSAFRSKSQPEHGS